MRAAPAVCELEGPTMTGPTMSNTDEKRLGIAASIPPCRHYYWLPTDERPADDGRVLGSRIVAAKTYFHLDSQAPTSYIRGERS